MESHVILPVALFVATVVFGAYTVRGIAGFEPGLIATPLLALSFPLARSFPLTLVVPLVLLLDFVGSAGHGVRNRALVSWCDLAPLLPFTALGVLAAYLLDTLDATVLRRALGVCVLAYALYQLSSCCRWRCRACCWAGAYTPTSPSRHSAA